MLDALKARLATVSDLNAAAAVLEWDQGTFMPPAAAEARADRLDETALDGETDRALVRVTRRDVERARRRPETLVRRQALTKARALEAWKQARADDDFARFAPLLEQTFALAREEAEVLGYAD